jgi:hypothetical protein
VFIFVNFSFALFTPPLGDYQDPRKKLDGLQSALEGIGDLLDMHYSDAFNHVKDELFRVFWLLL